MAQSINSGANVINYAKKASAKVVERYSRKSATAGLFSNDYDWKGVRTVEVRSIDTVPLQDYNETKTDGTSRYGTMYEVGDTVQELTVSQHKSIFGTIDKSNNDSVMQTKAAGRFLKRETDEVIIPYKDKYNLKVLAEHAGCGYFIGSTALSSSNIIEKIMLANAAMSNQNVPDNGRVLFMGYTLATALKLASQVVGIDSIGEKAIVDGVMGKVDKCQVRLVPDNWMPTGVHFMIVKTGAGCAPIKIEDYKILPGGHVMNGYMVVGDLMHDCFVFNAKRAGVCVCMDKPYSVEAGDAASIAAGATYQLKPTIKMVSGGDDIAIANFTYSSGTVAKATVDANGLVTGVAAGSSVITVAAGSASDTVTITVT